MGGGGGVVKKRESPDFRSPEVGISALPLKNSTTFKAYPEEFYRSSSWGKELGVGGGGVAACSTPSLKYRSRNPQFTGEVTMP